MIFKHNQVPLLRMVRGKVHGLLWWSTRPGWDFGEKVRVRDQLSDLVCAVPASLQARKGEVSRGQEQRQTKKKKKNGSKSETSPWMGACISTLLAMIQIYMHFSKVHICSPMNAMRVACSRARTSTRPGTATCVVW